MSYLIYKADGTLLANVADDSTLSTATSLTLFGRGTTDYGTALNSDLILLLQNFATGTAPVYPLEGQLWFDTSVGVLKIYSSSTWSGLAMIGGFGDTGLSTAGQTLAGNTGTSVRVAGSTGFVVTANGASTNITLILSEGQIISAISAEAIPSNVLPVYATIRGYSFPFAARFPTGLAAGYTLANNGSGPAYTGLGSGAGAGLAAQVANLATQNDDLLGLINSLQASVGASISTLQNSQTTSSAATAQQITALTATLNSLTGSINVSDLVTTDQFNALATQVTTLASEYGTNASGISQEASTRADAITALSHTIDTLTASVGAANAALSAEQTARTTAETALSQQITELQAGLTTTGPDGSTILALSAQITAEQTARIAGDTSNANAITSLTATVGQNTSDITTNNTAQTNATSALASQVSALSTTVGQNTSAITAEQTARTAGDSANATAITNLTATVDQNTAAIATNNTTQTNATSALASQLSALSTTVDQNTAAIQTESTARTTADAATASTITSLQTQVGQNTSDISANNTAQTSATSALASQVSALSTSVGQNAAAITAEATARSNLSDSLTQTITILKSQSDQTAADISNEYSARTTADTALSTQITNLSSTVDSNQANLTQQIQTISTANTATATSLSTLQATVAQNTSDIATNATTAANATSALASQVTSLTASATQNEVFIQASAPPGQSNAVWFNTSDGNTPYYWDGSAWDPIQDAGIANVNAALQSEITARTTSDSATTSQLTDLITAVNNSIAAYQSSNSSTSSNDQALANSVALLTSNVNTNTTAISNEATTRANAITALSSQLSTVSASANRQRVYFQTSAPNGQTDAVWFNLANNNTPYYWNGSAWVPAQDGGISTVAAAVTTEQNARTTADTALSNLITALTSTVSGNTATITANATTAANATAAVASNLSALQTTVGQNATAITNEATTRANADTALSTQINTVSSSANRQRVFVQNTAPTGNTDAVWFDTADGNKPYSWNGTTWVPMQDTGIATVAAAVTTEATARTSADTALSNQITSLLSTVNGNTAAITANATTAANATAAVAANLATLQTTVGQNTTAITTEATTRANADTALSTQINTVSSSANRQRVFVQNTAPTGNTDAVWFDTADGNKPYSWNGTTWVPMQDAGIATVAAAVSTEATARTSGDTALSNQITSLLSTVNGNTAAITANATTAANATAAVAANLSTLQTTVGQNATAITTEATTRANADTALSTQITTVSSSANRQRVFFQSTAPTGNSDAVWFNTSQGNTPYSWSGSAWVPAQDAGIAGVSAAVTSEASTRTSADTALGARIDALLSTVNGNVAAITSEATTRATNDTALSNLITALTSTVGQNTAAITAEQTARASGDAAQATARQQLSATLSSTLTAIKTWVQGTAPTLAAMFPPGTNYHANSLPSVLDTDPFTYAWAGTSTHTNSTQASTTIGGYLTIQSQTALTTTQYMDVYMGAAAIAGNSYEFSAYLATQFCTGMLFIQFMNAAGSVLATVYSGTTGQGLEYNGGLVTSNTVSGSPSSLTNFQRIWVYGVAPANTASVNMIMRGNGIGGSITPPSGSTPQYPTLVGSHFYFGVMQSGQTAPTDWQQANVNQVWYNTASNNQLYVWNAPASTWAIKSDARIDANIAAITAEQTARIAADNVLTTNYQTVLAATNANAGLITTEQTTRANADTALGTQITTVSAVASRQRVFYQNTAPTGAYDAVWYNTANNNIPYLWNGSAWVSAQDATLATISASVSTEQTARAAGDTALAAQITTLTSNLGLANAAITTEANTRAAADTLEAATRQNLSATTNQKKTWFQAAQPAYTDMFPAGTNAYPLGTTAFGTTGLTTARSDGQTASSLTVLNVASTASIATLGSNVLKITTNDSLVQSTSNYMDIRMVVPAGLVAGAAYEFSAYFVATNCKANIFIAFQDVNGNTLTIVQSPVNGQGGELNGGAIQSNTTSLTSSLSTFGRLWVYGTAPTNAVGATVFMRLVGAGVANPILYVTRPYFGAMLSGQTAPAAWVPANLDQLWLNSASNNTVYAYNAVTQIWGVASDQRIDANIAAITTEQNVRLTNDNALASLITALTSTVNGNTAAISAEATTRAQNDSALSNQINQISAQAAQELVYFQNTAPPGAAGVVWFNTAQGNTPYMWNGSAWVPAQDQGIVAAGAAITNEATTRATNDAALGTQISNLQTTLNGNIASAVAAEATVRANSVAAEAATRQSLMANLTGSSSAQKLWVQGTAPVPYDMFPAGTNMLPDAIPVGTAGFTAIDPQYTSSGIDASGCVYPGGHTAWFTISGALASGSKADVLYSFPGVTAGFSYEISASLGATHCNVEIILQFFNSSGATATYVSNITGQGAEYSDVSGLVPADTYFANSGANSYARIMCYGYAPSGTTGATCYIRILGTGASGATLYIARPYFGRMAAGQSYAAPWAATSANQIWLNTANNNTLYAWTASSATWVASSDQRIAQNAAAITSEATTRSTNDASLSSRIDSTVSTFNGNLATTNNTVSTLSTNVSANATAISNLTTTVNGNTSSISTLQSSVGGLSASYAVVGTVNGQTGGFTFTGVQRADGTGAVFTTTFASNVVINGSLLVNGTISQSALTTAAVGNLQAPRNIVELTAASGTFTVPATIGWLVVQLWGAGAGSTQDWVSGPSGGYAEVSIQVTPGQQINYTVGQGGAGGGLSSTGGTTSFGSYLSATGGSANVNNNTNKPGQGSGTNAYCLPGSVGQTNFVPNSDGSGATNIAALGAGTYNSSTSPTTGYLPGGGGGTYPSSTSVWFPGANGLIKISY